MRRLLSALGFLLLAAFPAHAQMSGVRVVSTCGTPSPWPALATSPLSLASSAWLTVDTNYTLCTSAVITGSITANSSIVNWGGGVLGAMAAYGTSPGAVLVPGVNAFVTNTAAMNLTQVAGSALGAITTYGTSPGAVNVPSVNAYVTNTSTSPPAGFTPNGNYASLAVTAVTGNVALPAGTSVAVANTGSQTAFVNLGTSNAVTATTANIPVGGGQTIAFTVGSNTYLAGIANTGLTTNLTLAGGAGAYSGTGGSVTLNAPPNDVTAGPTTFTTTNTGTVAVSSLGSGAVGVQVTGSSSSYTITFEATVDNTNWFSVNAFTQAGAVVTSTTTTGNWIIPASGYRQVRANLGTHASGTIVITVNASAGSLQQLIGANGVVVQSGVDPCNYATKLNLAISTNSTSLAQIIAASGSTKIYVCSISIVAAGATAFNLNTGTGSNCASSTAALFGSTTAANGMSFAANGGFTIGSGNGTIAVTAASSEICTLQSQAVYVSGNLTYVQQ